MPNFSEILGRASRTLSNNSPVILTGVGVAGVLATAFLTGRATFKASELIRIEETTDKGPKNEWIPLNGREKFDLVWKLYIPSAVAGFATVTAIICSNRIDSRRAAAVAAAWAISERGWNEYKHKIVEKLGEHKERAARDEIAQEQVTKNPPSNQVVILGGGSVLCFDRWSGRYLRSNMETLKKAQNDVNYQMLNHEYASLSDFYDKIGLAPTQESDDIGWNSDVKLELEFSTAMSDEGEPCITFGFQTTPFRY